MDFLIEYAGEIILGFFIVVSRIFGKTETAEKLQIKLSKKRAKRKKKLSKRVRKEAAKLEKDFEKLKEEE